MHDIFPLFDAGYCNSALSVDCHCMCLCAYAALKCHYAKALLYTGEITLPQNMQEVCVCLHACVCKEGRVTRFQGAVSHCHCRNA